MRPVKCSRSRDPKYTCCKDHLDESEPELLHKGVGVSMSFGSYLEDMNL